MSIFGTWLKDSLIGCEIIDVEMNDIDIKRIKIRSKDGDVRTLSATSEYIWVGKYEDGDD